MAARWKPPTREHSVLQQPVHVLASHPSIVAASAGLTSPSSFTRRNDPPSASSVSKATSCPSSSDDGVIVAANRRTAWRLETESGRRS